MGALAIAAGATELAARTATHLLGACQPVCITQYDPRLGWTNAPGSVGRHREPSLGIDVTYRIDARGTRADLDHHPSRPDAPRVLVLGDSNGFGWGVADDRHFGARLSRISDVAVLNLSVSGYGTDQALLRFLSEGIRFQPHLVVVQSTANDFDDIQRSLVDGRPKPRFDLEDGGLRLRNVPVDVQPEDADWLVGGWLPLARRAWLAEHSYFYTWLNHRWQRSKTPSGRLRFSTTSVALFRALVEEIRLAAVECGAALVLLHASSDIRERQKDAIPPGVNVLDLSEAFSDAGQTMFADNLHWNDKGHHLAADRIAQWMFEHNRQSQGFSAVRD